MAIKIIGIIFVILISIIVVFLLILTIIHRIKLSFEQDKITPIGQIVEVNDHNMHVYLEGEHASYDSPLLVFLGGSGDPFPVFTFRPLYVKLSDDYRIAVVERAGFGYSEKTDQPRDIDTILSETREALRLVGETGPYIIFPHSMAGIEALRWAQMYPNEVLGIAGVDMAVPMELDHVSKLLLRLTSIINFTGVHRLFGIGAMNSIVDLSAIEADMTEHEKEQMRLLFNRNYFQNESREGPPLINNIRLVKESGIPDVPMILFFSNEFELIGTKPGTWFELKYRFSLEHNAPLIRLDAGHLLMSEEPEILAQHSREFIATILHKRE